MKISQVYLCFWLTTVWGEVIDERKKMSLLHTQVSTVDSGVSSNVLHPQLYSQAMLTQLTGTLQEKVNVHMEVHQKVPLTENLWQRCPDGCSNSDFCLWHIPLNMSISFASANLHDCSLTNKMNIK